MEYKVKHKALSFGTQSDALLRYERLCCVYVSSELSLYEGSITCEVVMNVADLPTYY